MYRKTHCETSLCARSAGDRLLGSFFFRSWCSHGAQYECGMKPSRLESASITYTQSFSLYKTLTI